MLTARNTVIIAKPVDEVFTFVADGTNAKRWRPAVLDVALASGSGLGATYTQGVKGPGGRRIAADYTITAFEPNRRIAFRAVAGPVRPEGEYVFEDLGGSTRVTLALTAELSGWKKLVMGGPVQASMDAEVANIERLGGELGA